MRACVPMCVRVCVCVCVCVCLCVRACKLMCICSSLLGVCGGGGVVVGVCARARALASCFQFCLQVVYQAPQHFRSVETKATCDGCFCPPICRYERSFSLTPACPGQDCHGNS